MFAFIHAIPVVISLQQVFPALIVPLACKITGTKDRKLNVRNLNALQPLNKEYGGTCPHAQYDILPLFEEGMETLSSTVNTTSGPENRYFCAERDTDQYGRWPTM